MSIWSSAYQWVGRTFGLADAELYAAMGGAETATSENVTTSSVLGLSAAWGCVSLLTGTISSLSCDVYKKQGSIKVRAEHPLQSILSDPNADQTEVDFWEQMTLGLELQGNAYAKIDRRSDGSIIALTPIRPDAMSVERATGGRIRYTWYEEGKRKQSFEDGIFHIRGKGGNALGGMSPIAVLKNTFGTAQAVERAAGATFANGAMPSGILSTERTLTGSQRPDLEKLMREKYQGARNSGTPMILDDKMTWESLSFRPDEAQMLESRAFSVEDICRAFDVPPFMVGHTEKVTSWGSGLEQQILGFQKFALRKRLKKIEKTIVKQLMSPEDRRAGFTVSFNIEDLLRGDSKARAAFYRALLDAGVITINEVRALEGLPPIEGGDVPRIQKQNVPITEVEGMGHNGGPPLENEDELEAA